MDCVHTAQPSQEGEIVHAELGPRWPNGSVLVVAGWMSSLSGGDGGERG